MKKELDHFLVKRFPEIFKNRYASPTETCMSWGFECGDGWFQLLYQACSLVEGHIKHIKENNEFRLKMKAEIESGKDVHENWKKEYAENGLDPKHVPQFVASQVKEKFGTLRFYYQGGDEYISGVINSAESTSCYTCEECGNPGKTRHGGWVRTLCDKHAQEDNRELEEKEELQVGSVIYALVEGDRKTFIIKEIQEKQYIAKEKNEHYNKETKDYVTIESEENYLIKYFETEIFSYYDATKIE